MIRVYYGAADTVARAPPTWRSTTSSPRSTPGAELAAATALRASTDGPSPPPGLRRSRSPCTPTRDGAADRGEESGFEGVACVDDAARLLDVLCDVWTRTRSPWVERWARGLLDFVLWMQEPDGRVAQLRPRLGRATRTTTGITSRPGENFWHARALVGVSHAWLDVRRSAGDDDAPAGLDHAATKHAPPDVRALHILAALR